VSDMHSAGALCIPTGVLDGDRLSAPVVVFDPVHVESGVCDIGLLTSGLVMLVMSA
jgi:hypothetical protein